MYYELSLYMDNYLTDFATKVREVQIADEYERAEYIEALDNHIFFGSPYPISHWSCDDTMHQLYEEDDGWPADYHTIFNPDSEDC